ncbi:hypothetical protein Clacol_003251 [Clathrus columnatus]|uniref:Major facilitator superfamily (MFS) profile domain-containing protein n=1 Tax=Clathrus columnatus TaxID=1419009 RepID=A0AAV5A2Y6_9AGAM|nr:hypothetical protein Clacol_003251 [Clathrus columnatus]
MALAGTTNYASITAVRFLLGAAEALVPGFVYFLTFWYKPEERSLRVALILASSTLAGAFGGAIAFGVGKLNRVHNLEAWRYLFLIEGAPSCAVAILVYFFFPDWPETASWLNDSERELAVSRLKGVASLGSLSLFSPTIVSGLGYENLQAQLFTVRLLSAEAFVARYVLLCIASSGSFACVPPALGWLSSNLHSTGAAGLAIAMSVSFGGPGQIIGRGTPEVIHASGGKAQFEEGEESWDDAYADDDGPSSPPRRVPKAQVDDDEEIEDWDSSDNDAEDPKSFPAHEYGGGTFEEEDRTVTARSTASSRFRTPSPLPLLPPPAPHTNLNIPSSEAVAPLSIASPTLSTFSIPPSSNLDHSVYSNEGLIRGSSNSVPRLAVLRSYPNGAGSTPPRKGRRLRKKSRPPRKFGSFKRWTRRSIGPEDTPLAGWRRAKSSFGPADVAALNLPVEVSSADLAVENIRSTSPPAPPVKNRNRGSSASGIKSGWFFRSGGAADNETIAVPPKQVLSPNLSSPTQLQAEVASGSNEPTDRENFTPTPRKSKGRLVPILKSPIKKKHESLTEQLSESFGAPPLHLRPGSSLSNTSKYGGFQFPRYSASVGRHTGSSFSAELLEKEKGNSKDKDGGMISLVKGVRRLSQVGVSGHKRAKSNGRPNDESKPAIEIGPDSTSTTVISTLLPPVELNSPILPTTIFSRRGSLGRTEFSYVLPINGHDQPAYTFAPNLPLENTLSMERMSFSSSRAPSRLELMADKPPTGSPPRPKPSRRETSPLPVPPSPVKQIFKPESVTPSKRPGSSASTRRPGSSSSSTPSQALAAQSFRPRTPIRNSPTSNTMSSSARPRTPNKLQTAAANLQQHSTAPSAYTASLGRTATPPQVAKPSLKRNSLNDLKAAPNNSPKTTLAPSEEHLNGGVQEHKSLDQRRASTNTLGELKIPARIFKAQQGLRRDLGMVREFAGYVELTTSSELKRLQNTYMKLIEALCVAYDSYPIQHVTSRPPSQMGLVRKGLTANSNASTQNSLQQPTSMLLNSPTKAQATRSFSRASGDLNRELARLEQDYGLWWECAELLVELGGGSSSMVAAVSSNPNLTSHSSSSALSTNTTYDDPPLQMSKRQSRSGTHTPSMSDPGTVFSNLTSSDSSRVLLEASPPQNHSRSSTGRHDLSARQLRLLRDMLNTPDPSALPDNPAYTHVSGLLPSSSSHPYLSADRHAWNGNNPSALTLRSDESSAEHIGDMIIERTKEKKRRLGIIDFLRAVKKAAIAEGRLAPRSESSLSSHTDADDDHYNRRKSPWHQHDVHHAHEQIPHPAPKSPSRPSLASIFRIGGKDKSSKTPKSESFTKTKGQALRTDRKVSAESSGVGDADDEYGDAMNGKGCPRARLILQILALARVPFEVVNLAKNLANTLILTMMQ